MKLIVKSFRVAEVPIVDRWSLRTAARRLYPKSPDLARKWIRAWHTAPGPRCAIGTRTDADKLEVKRTKARAYLKPYPQPSLTCPLCHKTSYNPHDIEQRYCGKCHLFHDDMRPGPTLMQVVK